MRTPSLGHCAVVACCLAIVYGVLFVEFTVPQPSPRDPNRSDVLSGVVSAPASPTTTPRSVTAAHSLATTLQNARYVIDGLDEDLRRDVVPRGALDRLHQLTSELNGLRLALTELNHWCNDRKGALFEKDQWAVPLRSSQYSQAVDALQAFVESRTNVLAQRARSLCEHVDDGGLFEVDTPSEDARIGMSDAALIGQLMLSLKPKESRTKEEVRFLRVIALASLTESVPDLLRQVPIVGSAIESRDNAMKSSSAANTKTNLTDVSTFLDQLTRFESVLNVCRPFLD